jgi:hypothetical protein
MYPFVSRILPGMSVKVHLTNADAIRGDNAMGELMQRM